MGLGQQLMTSTCSPDACLVHAVRKPAALNQTWHYAVNLTYLRVLHDSS